MMYVIWRRLCVSMICSELGKGATSEAGKSFLKAANVWWRCAQYYIL